MVSYFCHQVLLVIELLAKEDLREHLLTLRPEYVHTHPWLLYTHTLLDLHVHDTCMIYAKKHPLL